MSVIKSKRGVSEMEFLANARKLQIHTIRKCVGFPKRYTFYLSQPIAAAATRVYEHAKRGNSIYPVNQHEAQLRRDCFLEAYAELQSLVSQIEIAHEMFGIDPDAMKTWMGMIDAEMRLVRTVIKNDRARYKALPA